METGKTAFMVGVYIKNLFYSFWDCFYIIERTTGIVKLFNPARSKTQDLQVQIHTILPNVAPI